MSDQRVVMFYDGECGFCSNSVQFILNTERNDELTFCPLQSDFAKNLLAEQGIKIDLDTIYVLAAGVVLSRSRAIQIITSYLRFPYATLGALIGLVPRRVADWGYDLFASNRYKIQGKVPQCLLPTTAQRKRFLNID